MIYLACPYSHPDEKIRQERFETVTKIAHRMNQDGYVIYSPITVGHATAQVVECETNWEFWASHDSKMIQTSAEVWILMLDGWNKSTGVNEEIKLAGKFGKELAFIDPEEWL